MTTLTRTSEPERARRYLAALYTTCDYFLGCNSLNQTWVTGLGPRCPTQIFHMDAWYNGKGRFHPGLIPYSPWRKEEGPRHRLVGRILAALDALSWHRRLARQ